MFLHLFNRESVYYGYDIAEFNELLDALSINHIKYQYKIRNRTSVSVNTGVSLRGQIGSGVAAQMYEYEIFVHKRDVDEAIHLQYKIEDSRKCR